MRRILRGLMAAALLFGGAGAVAPSAQAVEPQLAVLSVSTGSCTNTTPVVRARITPIEGEVVYGLGYRYTNDVRNPVPLYADLANGLTPGDYTLTLPSVQAGTSVEFQIMYSSAYFGGDIPPVVSDPIVFTAGSNCNGNPDTDGDGFIDANDACPTVYSTTNGGCPPPSSPPKDCTFKGKGKSLGWWNGVGNKHAACPRR